MIERYQKRILIDPATGCWLWQGAKTSKGRGCVRIDGRTITTHKLFFTLLIGPVPDGMELHHKCEVKHCCNPEHLVPKTRLEHRRLHPGRRYANAEKTHCKNGHPFDADNTYLHGGQRHCKECRLDAWLRHFARKEANA
jgi:hypothetical protein